MTLPKYPAYKDSGVEWLGEIPTHWGVKKLKFLGNIYAGINGKKGDDFSKENNGKMKPFLPFTNICNNIKINNNQVQYVNISDNENQNRVKKNDILFLMSSETLEDIAKNSIYLGNENELYLNSFCKGFRIKNNTVNPEFFNYLFLSKPYRNYFSLVGRGFTRVNLKQEYINDVFALLPSFQEQSAIASFLDKKTAKIDQAISLKEKMIALLKERKQIIIQNAVTKGLNHKAKMKDSGVEWIGEIPEGWEVKKLKHLIKYSFSGGTPSTDKLEFWDGGIPWISSVDVKKDFLSKTAREISDKGLKLSSSNMAPKGSVVFVTRSGILQHTFALSILEKDMAINQDIKCLIFSKQLQQTYFLRLIQGNNYKILIETRQQAATVESINMNSFFNLYIPVPSNMEQNSIVDYIENQSAIIEKAIALQEQQIEKLKELKATLIDGAVTGKIKVN